MPKHEYDKILTRLTMILSRLNDSEALSVKELASEFGVSSRTIQRDFNNYLVSSYPIYKDGKRWKMQDGFKVEKTNSFEDAIVLDILEGLVSSNKGVFAKRAKKLLSKLKNDDINPFYTKLDMEDISDKLEEIKALEIAIKSKQEILCDYDFEIFQRKVLLKPLRIANYDGFWYLIALDGRNDTLKKYYLKNISFIEILDEKFEVDKKLDEVLANSISVWFDPKKKPYIVKLHIDAKIAKYFKRKPISKTQKIVKNYDDESMDISLQITHDMEIIPLVKYWLPYIKVLTPKRIDDMILEDINIYKSYIKKEY